MPNLDIINKMECLMSSDYGCASVSMSMEVHGREGPWKVTVLGGQPRRHLLLRCV